MSSGSLSIQHLTSHVPRPFTPGRLVTFHLSAGAAKGGMRVSLTISMGLQQVNGLLRKTDSRKRLVLSSKHVSTQPNGEVVDAHGPGLPVIAGM